MSAKPEDQGSAGELWSAAIIYGVLMHDVAKVLVDIEIHLDDGRKWPKAANHPLQFPKRSCSIVTITMGAFSVRRMHEP